jgi:hypothetical protein
MKLSRPLALSSDCAQELPGPRENLDVMVIHVQDENAGLINDNRNRTKERGLARSLRFPLDLDGHMMRRTDLGGSDDGLLTPQPDGQ